MKYHWKTSLLALCAVALAVSACNLTTSAPPSPTPTEEAAPIVEETATPENTPTDEPTPTATENVVTITVNSESLSIRRGPSTYYNVLAFFVAGQSATATARNSDGSWLYIPFPTNPSAFGWVAATTQYTTVQGDINSLPVQNTSPAAPAYIRNCTFHPMMIKHGDVVIKPQNEAPNSHQFMPGNYTAYDQSAEGKPQVKAITLAEGDTIDINTDGLGNVYYCP